MQRTSNSTPQKSSLLPECHNFFVAPPHRGRDSDRSAGMATAKRCNVPLSAGLPRDPWRTGGKRAERYGYGELMGALCHKHHTKKLRVPCWLASGNFWNLAIKIDWKGHCLQSTYLSYFSHERSIGQIGLSYVSYHITTCIEESE